MRHRSGRPVVVTGAAGFIGQQVVAELVRRGRSAVALDRQPWPGPLPDGVREAQVDLVRADPVITEVLDSSAGVIHLAGRPGVRDTSPGVEHDRTRDNVLATCRVLAATPADIPLVVASSSSVYGGSGGRPSRETDPLRPRGGYARSKVLAEAACDSRLSSGAPLTVVRPFTVVGTGQREDMAVARWLRAAAEGRALPVFGSLERSRDLTDVREVSAALVDLLGIGYAGHLNLASGTPRTLADITDAVARAVGLEHVAVDLRPAPVDDPPATHADTTRLREVLERVLPLDLDRVVAEAAASVLGPAPPRRSYLVS